MSVYKKQKKGKKVIKIISIVIIVISLIGILYVVNDQSGIQINIDEDIFTVKVISTKFYGKSLLFSEFPIVESGDSAMDVLKEVSEVSFNYGGGFVESINGLRSTYSGGLGEKNDWFYYINGMLSHIGSEKYIMHPGDVQRWDYHNWDIDRLNTAIIADYPEPFLHGFNGNVKKTYIVYSKPFDNVADRLIQSLNNLEVSASKILISELSDEEKSKNNLIIIDTIDNGLITELHKNAKNIGFFIEIENNKIKTYDEFGRKDLNFDHGGIIQATQNPWNPKGNWNGENVVWIITGLSEEDVNKSAEILIENPESIQNSVSIVIVNDTIYEVP